MNECPGAWRPELAERLHLLEGLAPHGAGPRTDEEWARIAAFDAPLGPVLLPDCETRDAVAPGPHGPVPVRIYTRPGPPAGQPGPALVWLHGGAFMFGDLDTVEADHSARYLAGTTGLPVVSVDYRLAVGGVHHPVPEDDCVAAHEWVRDGGAGLPIDPERVAVGGASAGACLAASVALRMRDAGTPAWRLLLVYPVAHAVVPEPTGELAAKLAASPAILRSDPATRGHVSENYLGGPIEDARPYAFPGDAADLSGLPPTYIENCEFDELRASGELFATQLKDAGVPVEVVTCCGVGHGHLSTPGSPYAYETLRHLCDRITP